MLKFLKPEMTTSHSHNLEKCSGASFVITDERFWGGRRFVYPASSLISIKRDYYLREMSVTYKNDRGEIDRITHPMDDINERIIFHAFSNSPSDQTSRIYAIWVMPESRIN